jgi:uncharacterized protein with GYD domain
LLTCSTFDYISEYVGYKVGGAASGVQRYNESEKSLDGCVESRQLALWSTWEASRPAGFPRREKGERHMPRYVVLVNWTDQGVRNVKQTIKRTDSGGEIAQKHGLKLEQAYWTVGPYDMVTIFDAPDDEALSAHLLEIGSLGNVRTTTLRAYDEEEMSGILQRLA